MSKEKPSIHRSDVDELFDRSKSVIFDLTDFATRNEAEVTIRISSHGVASLQVFEKTKNMAYYKELTQEPKSFKYQEVSQQI